MVMRSDMHDRDNGNGNDLDDELMNDEELAAWADAQDFSLPLAVELAMEENEDEDLIVVVVDRLDQQVARLRLHRDERGCAGVSVAKFYRWLRLVVKMDVRDPWVLLRLDSTSTSGGDERRRGDGGGSRGYGILAEGSTEGIEAGRYALVNHGASCLDAPNFACVGARADFFPIRCGTM